MVTKKMMVVAPHGLHGLPGSGLVQLVKSLDGQVFISTSVKEVKASSMLSVLSRGVKSGTEIEVKADGGSEQDNLDKVVEYLMNIKE